jgi:transposase InsO family protein
VSYYRHWREQYEEGQAALRAGQKYAVSISTVRNWDRAYRVGGLAALLPKKPGPLNAPQIIRVEIQFLVVALRRWLGWNEKRMVAELRQRGLAQLSHTSAGRIFKRYALPTRTYHTKARCDGVPKGRYEKTRPNQQWHVDFAETKLPDGTPVRLIALLDDFSRYCLRCQVVSNLTAEIAIQTVQTAWHEFGLPDEIVSDNGSAFTSPHSDILNDFGLRLRQKGIVHRLISPYWPEGNGKAEAFIKILKQECLNHPFPNLDALNQALAEFVVFYNHFRLHGALGFQTPVSRFLSVASVQNHALAGIPTLPPALRDSFPPVAPMTIHAVNRDAVMRPFALSLSFC